MLVSAMIFAIIVGGYLMARLVAVTGLTELLVERMIGMGLGRIAFLLLLVLLYLILGAFLDVFGMLVLTIPFIVPVLNQMGIDLIWFGVFAVMMTELALVTPPIGANVFVMRRVAPGRPDGRHLPRRAAVRGRRAGGARAAHRGPGSRPLAARPHVATGLALIARSPARTATAPTIRAGSSTDGRYATASTRRDRTRDTGRTSRAPAAS